MVHDVETIICDCGYVGHVAHVVLDANWLGFDEWPQCAIEVLSTTPNIWRRVQQAWRYVFGHDSELILADIYVDPEDAPRLGRLFLRYHDLCAQSAHRCGMEVEK